ncbi:hypothetical protein [Anaerocaecibacter muris]|uniref:hypothetical protein n=1 Tax=Anaerocaecibacter muris TaxID=2941513 RepID=UPI003F69368A
MEYYQILIVTLIPLTIILVLSRLGFKRTSHETCTKRILRILKFYRIIPLLVFSFSLIASICIFVFHFDDWPYVFLWLGFLGIPSLILFITWSLWKVEMKSEGFVFRDFSGRKNEYNYRELEYREHPKGLKWYFYKNDRKVICIPYYIEGGDALKKVYQKTEIKND